MLIFYLILVLKNSFISPSALEKSGLAAYEHDDFKQVEMASREKQAVGPSVDKCIVDLGVCTTRLKVYVTSLGVYDLIIGMDWLAAHRALVDCFTNEGALRRRRRKVSRDPWYIEEGISMLYLNNEV